VSVAAIDIGSNSLRLLIVDDDGTEIVRDVTITGLGSGVEQTGQIDRPGYDATIRAIERYAATIGEHDVDTLEAVATSASRDAANGNDLMEDIERVLGTRPRVIGGDAEAALAFAGATTMLPAGESKLVVDIGGGSTEFVFGRDEPTYVSSVDMGSVRLTDRCVVDRPIPADVIEAVRAECHKAFAPVAIPGAPDRALGVAGTFTTLSVMAMDLDRYDREVVHGSVLRIEAVEHLVEMLAGLTVEETARIPSLDPGRARVIFAGAVVSEQAMVRCGLDAVTISEYDLLDGLAAVALARS
jgi:exopolyphosphatase / guanosine-5'-triphosphate,3'-diphosphate pyrophosphatase